MTSDILPELVKQFVLARSPGTELLEEVRRHTRRVTSSYPDAYFVLAQRTPDAVEDLALRVFTTCASVQKGRFPFMGRAPFVAFVEEQMEGRAIRYHGFYAKLSIARELMRADYAHNLSSHPWLAWRADLYADISQALPKLATPIGEGPPSRARWTRPPSRLVAVLPEQALVGFLRRLDTRDVGDLVAAALERGGPRTRSQLTGLLEEVLGGPPDAVEDSPGRSDPLTERRVREAVLAIWQTLSDGDRAIFSGLAEGLTYDEIAAANTEFPHKVAVNRALARCTGRIRAAVAAAIGAEATGDLPPAQLAELILDVVSR